MSRETGDNLARNPSGNTPMDEVVERFLSRRSVLQGGLGAALVMRAGVVAPRPWTARNGRR